MEKLKSLEEVIELNRQILRCADLPEDDVTTTAGMSLYYLKNYKELIDGIVNVIVQYKETFKAIIEDCENDPIGNSETGKDIRSAL